MINKFDSLDWILANGQRPFRYSIDFSFPSTLSAKAGYLGSYGLNVISQNIKLPDKSLLQNKVGVQGRSISKPIAVEYSKTCSFTFMLDEFHIGRRIFEYWVSLCDSSYSRKEQPPKMFGTGNLPVGLGTLVSNVADSISGALSSSFIGGGEVDINKGINGMKLFNKTSKNRIDYVGEVTIKPLSYSGNPVAEYVLKNVYPLSFTTEEFNDTATDKILNVTVELCYTHYEYNGDMYLPIIGSL